MRTRAPLAALAAFNTATLIAVWLEWLPRLPQLNRNRFARILTLVIAAIACGAGPWLFCLHMQDGAITTDWPWLYRAGQAI